MSQKRTVPYEPEEFPLQPKQPEIPQPHDPNSPGVPEEAPDNLPQELPPDETHQPEVPRD
jgi:hypothetical protein